MESLNIAISLNQAIIIYGPTGTGKTFALQNIINKSKSKYKLIEIDSSVTDEKIDYIKAISRQQSAFANIKPIIFINDNNVLKLYKNDIVDIVTNNKNPVVIETDDIYSVPEKIKEYCKQIRFTSPSIYSISNAVKNIEGDKDISSVNTNIRDIRSAIITAKFCGTQIEDKTFFDYTRDIFAGKQYDGYDENIFVWLMHNADSFYYGARQVLYYRFLAKADTISNKKRFKVLNLVKQNDRGEVEFPLIFKKERRYNK